MQKASAPKDFSAAFSSELRLLAALVGRGLGGSGSGVDPCVFHVAPKDWECLASLAAAHRVLPLVVTGLQATPEAAVPKSMADRLAQEARRLGQRSLILGAELSRISRLLTDREIPMAALKGPALTAQAYPPGAARAMRDLDILIRAGDYARARAVLEQNGFVCEEPVRRLNPAQQALYARAATHISFEHTGLGYILEVHLRPFQAASLLPISVEALLAQAQRIRLAGGEVPTLSPWHHFLFVAAHGAKHGWWRLLWLADFAAFQRRYPEWFSEGLQESGEKALNVHGLQRVLDAAFSLSHLCFGSPYPSPAWLGSGAEKATNALVFHGIECLERGCTPVSYREKFGELANFLRLRDDIRYHLSVLKLYWNLTPDDLARVSLPSSLTPLYPALRPFLWVLRRGSTVTPPREDSAGKPPT